MQGYKPLGTPSRRLLLREGARRTRPPPGSPNFASQDKWNASWAATESTTSRVPARISGFAKSRLSKPLRFRTRWNGSRIGLPPRPASRARPVPNIPAPTFAIWRRGKFFLLGRVDFGEGGLQRCLRCPLFFPNTPYLLMPTLCVSAAPPCQTEAAGPVLYKERGEMACGLWKKTGKEPGCTTHPGSFLLRRGGRVWGNGVSEQPSRRLPISQKPLGRGPGEDLSEERSSPGIHAPSLNTGPARSWSRPPYGSRRCCRRGRSCRARRIPRRFHGRP